MHELVDADEARRGVDGARAVGRGVVEQQRVVRAIGRAAAGGQALEVERRAARQQREHDAQARVLGPPEGHEGVPGRVHLGHVAGHRRPPRRGVGPGVRGPGVDHEGRVSALQRLERRAEGRAGGGVDEHPCGDGQPHGAAPQELPHRRGVGVAARDRAPRREALGQLGRALQVGGEDHAGLVRREPLDAERHRGAEHRPVDPVGVQLAHAALERLPGRRDGGLGLAGELQRPGAVAAHQARGLVAARQRGQDRLGEEVLVDVDAHGGRQSTQS